jgi:uncharacterized protein (TIGR02678 family)
VADLATALEDERATAVRSLLRWPLLDSGAEPDAFRLVVRHADWLTAYFEQTCGWALAVDPSSAFARLSKRAAAGDLRPLRRTRGERGPFDRRRYQLLCLICAQLIRHPATTIGLLAGAVATDAGLDTSNKRERGAFVDALRALVAWGALRVTSGEIDGYLDSESANALLVCDTTRLHRLLASSVAPSSLPDDLDTASAIEVLSSEPRYGDVDVASAEVQLRWARHRVGRRLLDDPAVHINELSEAERDYLASSGGRRWARDRVTEAGFELEERLEGLVAVDVDRIATDASFPAPQGNAHQLALLLVDRLLPLDLDGRRQLGRLDPLQLERAVTDILTRFPTWAQGARDADGASRLARDAIDLLVSFRLVHRDDDGGVQAMPALARYRAGEPSSPSTPTLFEGTLDA